MAQHSSFGRRIAKASLLGLGAYWLGKKIVRSHRRLDLEGRTVLITGGSRGLGLALAREFALHDARIAICARDAEELAAAKEDLRGLHTSICAFTCDLRDPDQIRQLIENVESACGSIDVLVNNAGTIIVGPVETMTAEDFADAMDVNFWAAVHTTLALAPKMKARRFGRIVNIGSIGGKMPVPHLAAYCASKFALVGFSAAMRTELAKDGILVTCVNPGLMRTGSPRHANFKGKHKAEYAWFSIGDALPGLSMSASRAARCVVNAAVHGDAEVVLGLPAKVASRLYGLFPGLHMELAAVANRAFPNAAGRNGAIKSGEESESWITRSIVRHLGKRAERSYNQLKM